MDFAATGSDALGEHTKTDSWSGLRKRRPIFRFSQSLRHRGDKKSRFVHPKPGPYANGSWVSGRGNVWIIHLSFIQCIWVGWSKNITRILTKIDRPLDCLNPGGRRNIPRRYHRLVKKLPLSAFFPDASGRILINSSYNSRRWESAAGAGWYNSQPGRRKPAG